MNSGITEDNSVLEELNDALARVKSQIHVVRLAMAGMGDERDIRAIMSSLDAITEDLVQAGQIVKR